MTAGPPPIQCPACGAPFARPVDRVARCDGCGREASSIGGVLDLRVGLEGFDVEADRELAERLTALPDCDFEGLLRELWGSRPDVPAHLVERFIRADTIGAARAEEVVAQIESLAGRGAFDGKAVLEVGAGTAALGAAAARLVEHVVVTDVSLAWLVIARRRLEAAGVTNATVVACNGERLPFSDGVFDLVLAADVIEHVPDAGALASSCYRVLRVGGRLWLSTPNRLSLTPEPHVRLWGVGFLPHRVAVTYVRRLRGVDYSDIHTLSYPALRRPLAATGGRVRIVPPPIPTAVRAGYGAFARRLIDVYSAVARTPAARPVLLAVAPLFHATLTKEGPAAPGRKG